MDSNTPIFFLHIPKTAGTSVTALIEDNLSLSEALQMRQIRDSYYGNTLDYRLLKSAKAICGHIPLSVSRLMSQPVRTLVFLRSPVDLSISMFNHLKRIGEVSESRTLAEFLHSPYAEVIFNMQTKWLSGDQLNNVSIPMDRHALSFEFSAGTKIFDLIKPVDENSLKKAKSNLEQISFIGIFEKMKESISLLKSHFNFNSNLNAFAENIGSYDRTIDPGLRRLLLEKNSLDQRLYEFGLELYLLQTTEQATRNRAGSSTQTSWVELDMNDSISHEGFHQRELWPHWHGVRWTSDAARLFLPCMLDPSVEYSYEMTALATISEPEIHTTRLMLGGMDLDYHLQSDSGIHLFRGTITTTSAVEHPTLEITAPYARHPSEFTGSADTRLLGLAIKSFRLKPVRCCAINTA
ncbi:sulfotransferase family 2 domain-containing protein [Paraburkholderia sp. CNPSo 3076]|uniref:sulfotransferase family 2 domain-containing protein n=1 Tax=Paraburkholderia sp. CNPSo 3076 TaxID=2940936 RepID=UPI00225733FD|nr:sulfotransferase family 2 domain-containing protein [Paraburkholderia sp. CNPSo 3076]MCX5543193.1 sulfotransferase family 2 domain-containing protein [Paraburkholderia sp. CNPSo 3076]